MKRFALVILALVLVGSVPAAQDLERLFKAAVNTETVDRNCKAAIEQYKKVAAGSNRALAAQALLRMAGCHQKLGDNEAREIYQRLVNDFSDQKDVFQIAQQRLAIRGVASETAKGDRRVWTGTDVDLFGSVSPDGRFLTFTDWGPTNNLMIRDLTVGISRPLTRNTSYAEHGWTNWSVISRDGRHVAFQFEPRPGGRHEIRVVTLTNEGTAAATRTVRSDEHQDLQPVDWSPDGRYIALVAEGSDRSQRIGILSVADGSLRLLKSVGWRSVNKILFSPDGRFLAYDIAAGETPGQRHVRVLAVDTTSDDAIVSHESNNVLMAWTTAGDLLFASDRTGRLALWSVRVVNGRPTTALRLIKDNLASSVSLGLSSSGRLYVWTAPNAESVRVAPFDPERGSIVEDSGATWEQFIQSRGRPDWSADGHYLSFISCGHTGGGPCSLFVRDVVASTVREVPHDLSYFAWPRLSPDGRQLATNGTDKKGRRGAYLVDIATGQTVPIEPAAGVMDWSADGRRLYLVRLDETQATVVERDLSSGSNRDLFRMSRTGLRNYMQTSPDGRLLGTIVESGNAATLMVTRLADGVSTPVLTVTQPEVLAWKWEWTEDSAALLIIKGTPSTGGVWLVSLNGVAKRLEIPVGGEGVQISPDRTRVAFVAGAAVANGAEVWALENVIPPAAK